MTHSYNRELERKCQRQIEACVLVARPGPPMAYFEHMVNGVIKRVIYETVGFQGRDVDKLVEHTTGKVTEAIRQIYIGYPATADDTLVLAWRATPCIEYLPNSTEVLACRMRIAIHDVNFNQFRLGGDVVKPEGQPMDTVT